MRIAFIDNLQVGGGLSRFSLLLCKGLIEHNPLVTIDYYIHYDNLRHIPEINNIDPRVSVKVLESSLPKSFPARFAEKALSKVIRGNPKVDKGLLEIERRIGADYDLAYFPSAHMMKRPDIKTAVVGTLHDFNWRYFFGRQNFSMSFVEMMDEEILNWMNNGLNICSSHDVVDEAKKLYPNAKRFPEVVHIAPVVVNTGISDERAVEILKELNIDFPYIIFPGNFTAHKNHLNLFTAFAILKERKGYDHYKLLLTGMNSDQVRKGIAGRRGVQLLTRKSDSGRYDVLGMGYQKNEVIDALISKAKLLVSPSIYEAICTPAMDAWNFGTPTAISDIPPFREHEKVWGIRSAFFDPMNPANIADVLEKYLGEYDKAMDDARISRINMQKYGWKEVTSGYMAVFENAMQQK
jgi:glycosyltransferase involved in cell wall biosynthesis